jgi:hypothetical protein
MPLRFDLSAAMHDAFATPGRSHSPIGRPSGGASLHRRIRPGPLLWREEIDVKVHDRDGAAMRYAQHQVEAEVRHFRTSRAPAPAIPRAMKSHSLSRRQIKSHGRFNDTRIRIDDGRAAM